MKSFFKHLGLLILVYLLSLLTFPAAILCYHLFKGNPSGIADAGWLGCSVVYEHHDLAYTICLIVPPLLFAGIILILAKKSRTGIWFKFFLTLLFTLTYFMYYSMAGWFVTDFGPSPELIRQFGGHC